MIVWSIVYDQLRRIDSCDCVYIFRNIIITSQHAVKVCEKELGNGADA